MSEFETLQAVYAIRTAGAADVINFFTVLSAYLVVAYLVGDKLSSFQLWTISGLYSVYQYFPIAALQIAVGDLARFDAAPPGANLLAVLLTAMWFVSIVFMIQKRRGSLITK
jgi:hypothetical protein